VTPLQVTTIGFVGYCFYYFGKLSMFLALTFRLYFTFLNTSFQYSKKIYIFLFGLYFVMFIIVCFFVVTFALGDGNLNSQIVSVYFIFDIILGFAICSLYIRGLISVLNGSNSRSKLKSQTSSVLSQSEITNEKEHSPSFDNVDAQMQIEIEKENQNEINNPASLSNLTIRITILTVVMISSTFILFLCFVIDGMIKQKYLYIIYQFFSIDCFTGLICMILSYHFCYAYYITLCKPCHLCCQRFIKS